MSSYWTDEVLSIERDKKRSLVIAPCDKLAEAMAERDAGEKSDERG